MNSSATLIVASHTYYAHYLPAYALFTSIGLFSVNLSYRPNSSWKCSYFLRDQSSACESRRMATSSLSTRAKQSGLRIGLKMKVCSSNNLNPTLDAASKLVRERWRISKCGSVRESNSSLTLSKKYTVLSTKPILQKFLYLDLLSDFATGSSLATVNSLKGKITEPLSVRPKMALSVKINAIRSSCLPRETRFNALLLRAGEEKSVVGGEELSCHLSTFRISTVQFADKQVIQSSPVVVKPHPKTGFSMLSLMAVIPFQGTPTAATPSTLSLSSTIRCPINCAPEHRFLLLVSSSPNNDPVRVLAVAGSTRKYVALAQTISNCSSGVKSKRITRSFSSKATVRNRSPLQLKNSTLLSQFQGNFSCLAPYLRYSKATGPLLLAAAEQKFSIGSFLNSGLIRVVLKDSMASYPQKYTFRLNTSVISIINYHSPPPHTITLHQWQPTASSQARQTSSMLQPSYRVLSQTQKQGCPWPLSPSNSSQDTPFSLGLAGLEQQTCKFAPSAVSSLRWNQYRMPSRRMALILVSRTQVRVLLVCWQGRGMVAMSLRVAGRQRCMRKGEGVMRSSLDRASLFWSLLLTAVSWMADPPQGSSSCGLCMFVIIVQPVRLAQQIGPIQQIYADFIIYRIIVITNNDVALGSLLGKFFEDAQR